MGYFAEVFKWTIKGSFLSTSQNVSASKRYHRIARLLITCATRWNGLGGRLAGVLGRRGLLAVGGACRPLPVALSLALGLFWGGARRSGQARRSATPRFQG